MLFPIILSFFGFAYGLQYYPRYDGYVATSSDSLSQSGLAGGLGVGGGLNQNFHDTDGNNPGTVVIGSPYYNGYRLIYNPAYRTLQYVPNRSLYSQYLPYYRNAFYGGFNGRYAPRYQQNFDYQVPVSAAFINTGSRQAFAPNEQNVATIQGPLATVQSVQDVQGVAQNENRLLNIDQQVGHVQVPANVEVRSQGVGQPGGEVNNVPQQFGLVQNVVHPVGVVPNVVVSEFRAQPVGVVSNSYQPIIGYSQQLPVVGVPYARNIGAPIASNVGIGSQITGFRTDNGFASSGLVGALAAGGRSTVVQK